MGDSRGHWEGDTLVVETTNIMDRTGVGVNGGGARHQRGAEDHRALHARRRPTRSTTRSRSTTRRLGRAPWTMQMPLRRDDNYGMYEYACHEGNYALHNILSGARADERAAAAIAAPPAPTKK